MITRDWPEIRDEGETASFAQYRGDFGNNKLKARLQRATCSNRLTVKPTWNLVFNFIYDNLFLIYVK